MAETEKRAHQAGASLMTLEVRRSNQGALELYGSSTTGRWGSGRTTT